MIIKITSKIHTISGLLSGLFILALSISGSILIFHNEADTALMPKVQIMKGKAAAIDDCYTTVKTYFPEAIISHCILPEKEELPVSFFIYDSFYKGGKKPLVVYMNPVSARIIKTAGADESIAAKIAEFHRSFYLGKTGEWLLGFFALVFLLSITTGIILYRKSILAVLLLRKTVYRKGNLHQLIGVYALLFNLMIAFTGFWMQRYVFKKEFYSSDTYTRTFKASPPLSFKFDSAYSGLKKQYPDFTGSVIYFAQNNKGKTAVYGSRSSNAYIHSKKFADVILLDSSGSISKTRFINEIDPADRFDIINSQLHMGKYGGAGIKIIYFFFGLAGALLSITGFLMWLKRKKRDN